MRLCRFDDDRLGLVRGGEVYDVTALRDQALDAAGPRGAGDPLIGILPALAELSDAGLRQCRRVPVGRVWLLSPIQSPTKIIAAGDNYKAHFQEMRSDPSANFGHGHADMTTAGLFLKANSSLVGPSEGIVVRFPDRRTDYEVELVAVIGRTGADILREAALGYVAGYCLGLDITVRGPEDRSFRKSIDTHTVVGPHLVTADEIPNPNALRLSLSSNGTLKQNTSTADMVNDVARIIEYASSFYTLFPGDLVFTGTPDGVGPIHAGDLLRAEAEGIGVMEVAVRASGPREAHPQRHTRGGVRRIE